MATVKKAQYGDRITSRQKKRLGRISEKNPERAKDVAERMKLRATRRKRGSELYDSLEPDAGSRVRKSMEEAKAAVKAAPKAKNGKSFPDLNKDGKITKADILKGRGVIAKKGANIKKAQSGSRLKDSDYETSPFFQMEMKQRERGSKPKESTNLKSRQYKRLGRIEEKNPDRAYKVAERMELRKTREERGKGVAAGANFRQSYKQSEDEVKRPKANFTIPKVKKAQAGLKASNKRVGPIDPNGAWTKVQEMNLPPRNVKTKVSLTRDKQLGATKMMKMGGKAKAKKK